MSKYFNIDKAEQDLTFIIQKSGYGRYVEELENRINKAIETINKMICDGYTITNNGTSIYYMPTGYKSEFGIRATVLLDILKGGDSNE